MFVFPSRTESSVAANLAYAREACREAALYFDPFSAYDLARQISRRVADPQRGRD